MSRCRLCRKKDGAEMARHSNLTSSLLHNLFTGMFSTSPHPFAANNACQRSPQTRPGFDIAWLSFYVHVRSTLPICRLGQYLGSGCPSWYLEGYTIRLATYSKVALASSYQPGNDVSRRKKDSVGLCQAPAADEADNWVTRCNICRRRKTACDRQRPRCSLCARSNFSCEYTNLE